MQKLEFSTSDTIRIDEFLRRELPALIKDKDLSNSKIRRLIVAGCVSVNGKITTRPAFELRGRSRVIVNYDEEKFFYEKQPDDIKFEVSDKDVLYETPDLIFINKPPLFPVEQTITGNRDNLHDAVVKYLWSRNPSLRNPPYVGIMHRLDRETSGVILFTKTRSINKEIQEMFESHSFTKEYYAVVEQGKKPFPEHLTVEKYIGRISSKSSAGKWGTLPESKGGQYSKTDFYFVKKIKVGGRDCLLIKCNLYTGRTHQIRVHLSEAGFPILGDPLYGGATADRMYLHAYHLCAPEKFDVVSQPGW